MDTEPAAADIEPAAAYIEPAAADIKPAAADIEPAAADMFQGSGRLAPPPPPPRLPPLAAWAPRRLALLGQAQPTVFSPGRAQPSLEGMAPR